MLKKRKVTTITIETERLMVISQSRCLYSPCPACGDEVRMLTVEQAAALSRITWREIYRQVEAGELHFTETNGGSLLICLHSLNDPKINQKV
jgi:hypothetical protein